MSDNDSPDNTFHGQGSSTPEAGPPLAERARTLVALGGQSTLATQSRKHHGFPFGSMMPYADDEQGCPLFLISSMAVHTRNLKEEPKCSLFITRPTPGASSLGAPRITLIGTAEPVLEAEQDAAKTLYLERHRDAKQWASFGDFSLYRMDILDIYFVGGFGIMGWVPQEEYQRAQPDPLAKSADAIIEHVNRDHQRAVLAIAKHQWGIESTHGMMTSIDQAGFDAKLLTDQGAKGIRVKFPQTVTSPEAVREVMTAMVREATSTP